MAEPVGIAVNARPAPAPQAPVPPELRQAAEQFESMVLAQLLQPMFAALDTEGLGGGGFGEEIFRPMLVDQYSGQIARSGGVGLAQSIIDELQRMQAAAQPEAADGADR